MLAPISLANLIISWEEDAKPNKTDPENDLLKLPNLHSKYASQLVIHSQALRKARARKAEMLRLKTDYYQGNLNNKKDIDTTGWEPFPYKLKSKSDLDTHLSADKDLAKIEEEIGVHEDAMNFCQLVCYQVHDRSISIKAYLDYAKYKLGT
jgi:hypothetical protein